MTWRVETLNDTVDGELDALPADMRQLIVTVVLERVGAPHVAFEERRGICGDYWRENRQSDKPERRDDRRSNSLSEWIQIQTGADAAQAKILPWKRTGSQNL